MRDNTRREIVPAEYSQNATILCLANQIIFCLHYSRGRRTPSLRPASFSLQWVNRLEKKKRKVKLIPVCQIFLVGHIPTS